MTTTTITAGASIATLINTFTVAPQRQRDIVDLLNRTTEETMRHLPGFIATSIHASSDGTRVVNYAQWESVEAFQAMLRNPAAQQHMTELTALSEAVDPHLYTVESTHRR
ncbi:MAG TPA: antibiotic biosynthesis monooxygenase family protein [Pseudonocardiaceae bacterium]|jgi:quinol monooxygenase YgiN|nr:antibiotic biosynthesis monooxygenase family protein [Pseudonocardiaceae bacterium]